MVNTLIVLAGFLAMATYCVWQSVHSLRTGLAPDQGVMRLLRLKLRTRSDDPVAYWCLTIPYIIGAIFTVLGCGALVLALLGVFGPLTQ
jgi:hypothetical protein